MNHRILSLNMIIGLVLLLGCGSQKTEATALNPNNSEQTSPTPQTSKGPANRLARETSPYLLLHAHNPVDWYPWGPEAFEKAKKEDKPIFLSIGYSSCYWCHVMERLVFQDEKIAAYMNEHFVNIKVDREERPDVDDIYMNALIAFFQMVGSKQGGGWPLSMFLTPEGKPFTGGTYFPPESNEELGRVGFPTVLEGVVNLWKTRREDVEQNADILTEQVQRVSKPRLSLEPVELNRQLVSAAVDLLATSYDPEHGGLGFNPRTPDLAKFPVPAKMALLQYEIRRQPTQELENVVYHSLSEIAQGGIYDHLGGGFHRYSTDRAWHVPHFEKMLYDQAQLVDVYLEAYLHTNNEQYREVAEATLDFVLAEMTHPEGPFYSAIDAETEKIEGRYYVWSPDEVRSVLGNADADLFMQIYGMKEPQKFEHGYVLHLAEPLGALAEKMGQSSMELKARIDQMRQKLLAARKKRIAPLLDDKILTSWNGLMIRSFANAGRILGKHSYIAAADRAARFILSEMRNEQGQLVRTYRNRQARLNSYLDDYAFLIEGLLALNQATREEQWLNAAQRLMNDQIALFWDKTAHGFYFTSHHHEELIARTKNAYDSVLPSGNSVSVRNLIRLASLTAKPEYRNYAEQILTLFASVLERVPDGMTNMALALGEFLDNPDFGALRNTEVPPLTELMPVGAEMEDGDEEKEKQPELVTAVPYFDVDRLPSGRTCQVVVIIKVKDGWHINADPNQAAFLQPAFTLKSKFGTKMAKTVWPKGQAVQTSWSENPVQVLDGQLAVRGLVEVPANAGGQTEDLELQLRYQICNEQRCLVPKTYTIKGKIPVAPAGQQVKAINQKYFQPEKPGEN